MKKVYRNFNAIDEDEWYEPIQCNDTGLVIKYYASYIPLSSYKVKYHDIIIIPKDNSVTFWQKLKIFLKNVVKF